MWQDRVYPTEREQVNVLHGLANIAAANNGQVPGVPRSEVEGVVHLLVWDLADITGPANLIAEMAHVTVPSFLTRWDYSNVLWACAKLRINPGDVALDRLLRRLKQQPEFLTTESEERTLWAIKELKEHCNWQSQVEEPRGVQPL
jgi:hypothetical protein